HRFADAVRAFASPRNRWQVFKHHVLLAPYVPRRAGVTLTSLSSRTLQDKLTPQLDWRNLCCHQGRRASGNLDDIAARNCNLIAMVFSTRIRTSNIRTLRHLLDRVRTKTGSSIMAGARSRPNSTGFKATFFSTDKTNSNDRFRFIWAAMLTVCNAAD